MKADRAEAAFDPLKIPIDILPLIFEHLVDRRDLHVCTQLHSTFHAAATPLLYRTLDSRVMKTRLGRSAVCHPASTLLKKPEYARYVRHVRETGEQQGARVERELSECAGAIGFSKPELLHDCEQALKLCTNIQSFSWSDQSPDASHNDEVLLAFLNILKGLKLKQLTIRTYMGLSEAVWDKLQEFRGLTRVALWVMEGQPRVLQGWSEHLGSTLTHLELGRTAGVPASILVSVFSHLAHLRSLRLKGAPTSAILEILRILPKLESLDTEYFGSGISHWPVEPVARLRELTVRTSSVDVQGPQLLWSWIRQLLPFPSLESFTLNAFSTQGDAPLPRRFLLDMAKTHETTLKHFNVSSALLTLEDVECLCTIFPALETLSCSIAFCQEASQLEAAVVNGRNLRELRLHTSWVPSRYGTEQVTIPFALENARKLMLREKSRIRVIGVGRELYTVRRQLPNPSDMLSVVGCEQGQWVRTATRDELVFEVVRDFVYDA
ncbi:uncharacterized protein B0H18DRAFT_875389 [Fomitopsis serialis]|uniref:uncharacterized protein n=1 Tax=Fomitopsis serialis TaxID=139415 RepID=UPI002008ADCB|nr:uncharacterized protein B0H18DRAFT_875389 [Neoantrodia serialis]KAH9927776.1 hypothetical protein B0H18DRAFT_875389 [Neoantrodia serialis]